MSNPIHDEEFPPRLAAARGGCARTLGKILEAYRGYLLLITEQELGDDLRAKGGASDLVQETMCDAVKGFEGFQGGTDEELRAWLRRMLLNNLSSFVRRYRESGKRRTGLEVSLEAPDSRTESVDPPTPHESPSHLAQALERDDAVRRLLLQLPEDYRRVLQLRYHDGMTFESIGEALALTPNAARKLWVRAAKRFREIWGGTT
jgi:RNA polymerase sigma-70 factor, ECF subfamily